MKKSRKKTHARNLYSHTQDKRLPFIEHLHELRRRLFYIALSVIGVTLAAYSVQQHIVNVLLKPAHGQHFIYTSPGGGLDFLFRVCVYTGIAISIPIIVYQMLRYVEPLFQSHTTRRFITISSIVSGLFAAIGIVFGYYVGLPTVLHFLFHQFTTKQITPLVTIQSYISFVTVYMLGSAMLLQVPLILLFINRIKPLKPSALLHNERWIIVGAFVASALMNPTTNILSQLLVAGPIIMMYQISILIIWKVNRRGRRSSKVTELLKKDNELRQARLAVTTKLETFGSELSAALPQPEPAPAVPATNINQTVATHRPITRPVVKRHLYLNDVRPSYNRLPQTE